MNRLLYIAIYTLLFNYSYSQQNLIYNGDFEEYSSCPTTVSYPAQAPDYEITKCKGWTCPTYGTSDYFNTCATNASVRVPNNSPGHQNAYNGNGYLGLFLANYYDGLGSTDMWWEYIQGQFNYPLEPNKIYNLKFHISLAEYSDLMIKEFGAYISPDAISSTTPANLNVIPQLKFYFPSYFSDTINWVSVEGIYIANGGEKYLTIGNFNNKIKTDTLRRYYSKDINLPFVTYIYVDAIEFFDITDNLPIANVFTPNGDGVNDVWKLPVVLKNHEIYIYNRWGNEIIKGDAENFIWNGKTKNNIDCNDGTYFYVIRNKHTVTNSMKGFIQLNK